MLVEYLITVFYKIGQIQYYIKKIHYKLEIKM